ncbi:MAG TPA: ATP synthase subunit I [Woeseiaceae bacterium]|jgi:ATP synthase protein I|nr:ATP synthase subunit I [Woeseiaceae bacterium]
MSTGADGKSEASSNALILRVLLAQTVLTAVLAAVILSIDGPVSGYSALLGGLTAVVPNAFLALRLAAPRRTPRALALVRAAWIGELGKLTLTAVMFGAIFIAVRPLAAGAVFAGFVVAELGIFAGFLRSERARRGIG